MYLREIGTVPLSNREGEVEIAKRTGARTESRTESSFAFSVVITNSFALGEDLKRRAAAIEELVTFDEESHRRDRGKAPERIPGAVHAWKSSTTRSRLFRKSWLPSTREHHDYRRYRISTGASHHPCEPYPAELGFTATTQRLVDHVNRSVRSMPAHSTATCRTWKRRPTPHPLRRDGAGVKSDRGLLQNWKSSSRSGRVLPGAGRAPARITRPRAWTPSTPSAS